MITFLWTQVTQAALIVDDPVEPDSGWTAVGGFNSGFGLTSPIEGANLINMAGAGAEPASKTFTHTLGAGTYTSIFWVHNYSNFAGPPPGLTAHLQADGVNIDDLLVSSITPVPTAGNWAQWTLVHEVPLGDPRIGDSLGFLITDVAGQGNGAFDSLDISFEAVPEATSIAIWFIMGVGLFAFSLRRFRHRK